MLIISPGECVQNFYYPRKVEAEVLAMLGGAGTLVNGVSYTVAGTVFDWSGLGLDGTVIAGDILVIWYAVI